MPSHARGSRRAHSAQRASGQRLRLPAPELPYTHSLPFLEDPRNFHIVQSQTLVQGTSAAPNVPEAHSGTSSNGLLGFRHERAERARNTGERPESTRGVLYSPRANHGPDSALVINRTALLVTNRTRTRTRDTRTLARHQGRPSTGSTPGHTTGRANQANNKGRE